MTTATRRLRSRARLKFLVADWGIDKFREVLENEYLGRPFERTPSPPSPVGHRDHVGVHEQQDGDFYVGLAPTAGRVSGTALVGLADLMDQHAVRGARLTPYQKIVLIGVRPDAVEPLLAGLDAIGLSARPSAWRQNTMACTGIEFCKLAIVDTKNRARDLVAQLERRFPGLDTPITINVNGCPNACARTQCADIGLKGQLVLDDAGQQVEGFQVHLGGATGSGRELRPQAACPEGDQRGARRLRDRRRDGVPARTPGRRVLRRLGGARRRGRASRRTPSGDRFMTERAVPFHCPYCGEENLFPREDGWECRACLRAFSVTFLGQVRRPEGVIMTTATTAKAREFKGTHTEGRSSEELRELVSHVGAELEAGPGREHHRVGRGDLRRPVLHHLLHGRRGARPPGVHGRARDRRGVPGHRLPLRRDHRHPRRGPGHAAGQPAHHHPGAVGRRAGRGIRQGPLQDRDPDLCCQRLRKVQPLATALADYDAWATGLRRAETHNRVIAPVVGWDARKGKVKVSPLARWSDDDIQQYIADHHVLVNPLVYDGYPSIGCAPCTRRVAPGDDPRSGRWAGTNKTECGIHR